MADQAGVPAGVLARGLVATTDVPAGQAQPQMDPGGPDPQALLASLGRAGLDVVMSEGQVRVDPYRNGHRSSAPFDCSAWSSQLRNAGSGAAPGWLASTCPLRSTISVGTARTWKRWLSRGAVSTSTFTSFSSPARSVASRSSTGLTIRQGPHQVAHRSTSTGTGACSATSAKSSSPALAIQGRFWWQFPHLGTPSAAAGTRLRLPQCGQAMVLVRAAAGALTPALRPARG